MPDEPTLGQDAQLIRLLFEYGLTKGENIIRWADAQIVAHASPPQALIELSMTPVSRTGDLLSHLNTLAGKADYWEPFNALLGLLYERIASRPESTDRFASEVYCRLITTAQLRLVPSDLPPHLRFLCEFSDKFDLAQQGIRGNPEDVIREYLANLQSFEKFGRVPFGLDLQGGVAREWPVGFGAKTPPQKPTLRLPPPPHSLPRRST